jgi:hypothetical protein
MPGRDAYLDGLLGKRQMKTALKIDYEGVALSLLVSAILPQYQAHREKVRHDVGDESTLELAKRFPWAVAP